ncbi:hypothetical protein [Chryseobacterium sp.]|uniref:hypothetical protein n=1 Tax=Chryseobacterium sp. TaxID=1871047 RepID=UPI0025BF2848|nr:hypothetical protein [Chryseobacterium sp.]MBV8327737.1 hypothetical protein [Chryseobacterium sp.]
MKIEKVLLPGKEEFDFREYRYIYIQSGNGKITKNNFVNIVSSAHTPLIPKNGGVLSENFIIITPDNRHFYGLSYSKDLAGWRQQIEKGSAILNLNIGEIKDGKYFSVLNGEKYKLEDCQFERYNFYDETGNLIQPNTPIEKEKIL